MRFLLALARANAFTVAAGSATVLVALDRLVGAELVRLPFLQDAVSAGRVFPALLAGCGAVVVASDWDELERSGARSLVGIVAGRWCGGAVVAEGSALTASASVPLVTAFFVLLGLLATLLPRHWWLVLPALLYLQLYLPADLLPQ